MLTFAIPYFGEFGDIFWAPVSAIIFYKSFGGKKGMLGAIFNFMEEILPFLDFIPTFTIAWAYHRYVENEKNHSSLNTSNKNPIINI